MKDELLEAAATSGTGTGGEAGHHCPSYLGERMWRVSGGGCVPIEEVD